MRPNLAAKGLSRRYFFEAAALLATGRGVKNCREFSRASVFLFVFKASHLPKDLFSIHPSSIVERVDDQRALGAVVALLACLLMVHGSWLKDGRGPGRTPIHP